MRRIISALFPEYEAASAAAPAGPGLAPHFSRASVLSSPPGIAPLEDEDTTFDSSDFRNVVPRFTPEARKANLALVELLRTIAPRKHATPAQLALARLRT
jgi:aryl-alcohol dehydrogenase-like predicted oxidoreductase